MDREKELKALGKRIREIRKSKGLTQLELAVRVNKDYTSIGRLESGRTNPTYITLLKIAEGLDVNLADILNVIE